MRNVKFRSIPTMVNINIFLFYKKGTDIFIMSPSIVRTTNCLYAKLLININPSIDIII